MGGRSGASKNTGGVSPAAGVPVRSSGGSGVTAGAVGGPGLGVPNGGPMAGSPKLPAIPASVNPRVAAGAGVPASLIPIVSNPNPQNVNTTGPITASVLVQAGVPPQSAATFANAYNQGLFTLPTGGSLVGIFSNLTNNISPAYLIKSLPPGPNGSLNSSASIAPPAGPTAPPPAPTVPAVPSLPDPGSTAPPAPPAVLTSPAVISDDSGLASLQNSPAFKALPGPLQEAPPNPYIGAGLQPWANSRGLINANTTASDIDDGTLAKALTADGVSAANAATVAAAFNSGKLSFANGIQFQAFLGMLSQGDQDPATLSSVMNAFHQAAGGKDVSTSADVSSLRIQGNGPITGITAGNINNASLGSLGLSSSQATALSDLLNTGAVQFNNQSDLSRFIARAAANPAIDPNAVSLPAGPFASIPANIRPTMTSSKGDLLVSAMNAGQKLDGSPLNPSKFKLTQAALTQAGMSAANAKTLATAYNGGTHVLNATSLLNAVNTGQSTSALSSVMSGLPAGPNAKALPGVAPGRQNALTLAARTPAPAAPTGASGFGKGSSLSLSQINSSLMNMPGGSASGTISRAVQDGRLPVSTPGELDAVVQSINKAKDYGIAVDVAAHMVVASGKALDFTGLPPLNTTKDSSFPVAPKAKKTLPTKLKAKIDPNVFSWNYTGPTPTGTAPGTVRPNNINAPRQVALTPDDFDAIDKAGHDYAQKAAVTQGTFHHDDYVAGIAAHQGFDGLPDVVDGNTLNGIIDKGGQESFRTVKPSNGLTGSQLLHGLRHGPNFVGHGVYGHGTYMAYGDRNNAYNSSKAYGRTYGAATARMALKPGSQVIAHQDLVRMMNVDRNAYQRANPGKPLPNVLQSDYRGQSAYAMAKGYDGIVVAGSTKYLNILNRTALAIQDKDWD